MQRFHRNLFCLWVFGMLAAVAPAANAQTLCGGYSVPAGGLTYSGPQTLTCDTGLIAASGGFVDFTFTVDGAHNLTVITGGLTTFGGVVGGTVPLISLTTDAAGSTTLAGSVTTTDAQIYNDALTLGANATLSSTGNAAISLASTLDGANSLALNTGGLTTLGGVVGGTVALTSLTTDAAGSALLGGGVSTTGAQTYNDALVLGGDATLSSSGGGGIDFGSTVDGAHNLAVNTGGLTIFAGAVGGTTALTSLTTNGSGATLLEGNVSTTGAQTYNDAVVLGADAILTSADDGAIDLNSTIDGAHSLTVHTGGALTFHAAVGEITPLASLTMTSGTLAIDVHNIPIKISGNAHIGGTLSIIFDGAPSPGQSFTVLTAGSITGTYATVDAAGLAAGTVAAVTYNATSVTLTIAQTAPDLTVSMTHDPAYVPYGGLVTYTITVHNVGNIGVANAQISNTLPAGLTAATPSWTCTAAGGASCTASGTGALADSLGIPANPADSVTYLLNAWVDATPASESIQNTVTVTVSGDVSPANNTASDTLQIVLFRDGFDPPQ
jgi:uncharacterized repeat protein (TIGR01451 family)